MYLVLDIFFVYHSKNSISVVLDNTSATPTRTPQIFDQNRDGKIDRAEWVYVVEFVTASHAVTVHQSRHQPKSRVTDEMRAQLPPKLVAHLASDAFSQACMKVFDAKDTDKSNAIEPNELWKDALELASSVDPDAPSQVLYSEEESLKFIYEVKPLPPPPSSNLFIVNRLQFPLPPRPTPSGFRPERQRGH